VDRRRFLVLLLGIAALALAGRATWIMVETRHQQSGTFANAGSARRSADELYYEGLAQRLADGDGFKTPPLLGDPDDENADHPPLTVLFLAPVAFVTDGSSLAMRFAIACTGVATVVLSGLLGRAVAGERVGLVAAALAAVYPALWANDTLVMSEALASATTAAVLLATYLLWRTPGVPTALLLGAAAGVAMLSRSEVALLLPLVVVPMAWLGGRRRGRHGLTLALVSTAAAAGMVAPWVLFNMARFERPVLLSHGDGAVLAGANCDRTYHGHLIGAWDGFCITLERQVEPSVDAEENRRSAFRYIEDHWRRVPEVVGVRVARIWGFWRPAQLAEDDEAEGKPAWTTVGIIGSGWVLLALAVPATMWCRRHRVPVLPLLAPLALVTVVAAVFYGQLRFRAPAEPALVVLGAVALGAVLPEWLSARRTATPAVATRVRRSDPAPTPH